jgi:BirA family biotin operon repressor/biotin-[acetyl-CoA-carboxylase] ligase
LTRFIIFVNLVFIMVNNKPKQRKPGLSTKARILDELREKEGAPVSGSAMAKSMGLSRTAVWKGVQALIEAGYPLSTEEKGYCLENGPEDFLYPWEFGGRESMFRYFPVTGSTMDRAREFAEQGMPAGTVITAEKQSAGRGRNGRTWTSRQGGLFFSILERPHTALADYTLPAMIFQIAVARALSAVCGKQVALRWPNDIYLEQRKIAGIMTEVSGEGDRINWLAGGIGVNINNPVPSGRITSCAEICGHNVSRRDTLVMILDEIEILKHRYAPGAAYTGGNRMLAGEWNSLAEGIGGKAAVIDPAHNSGRAHDGQAAHDGRAHDGRARGEEDGKGRIIARGIFGGIDPAGRCIIKTEKGALHFSPGSASIILV